MISKFIVFLTFQINFILYFSFLLKDNVIDKVYIIPIFALVLTIFTTFLLSYFLVLFPKKTNEFLPYLVFYFSLNNLMDIFLISYFMYTQEFFDIHLLLYNRQAAFETFFNLQPLLVLLLIFISVYFLIFPFVWIRVVKDFSRIFQNLLTTRLHKSLAFLSLFTFLLMFLHYNPTSIFITKLLTPKNKLQVFYNSYFYKSIKNNQKLNIYSDVVFEKSKQKNIYIMQLESVNSKLVTPEITPNIYRITKENKGILLKNFQGGSIHTTRSQEITLCSILPSFEFGLGDSKIDLNSLNCLPKILKSQGYKTYYFQAYNLKYANVGKFMKSIGFDEVHSVDIMKAGDKELTWGYSDDIFLERVFEYMQSQPINNNKVFVYIVIGSVNHYPFTNPPENILNGTSLKLPFENPTDDKSFMSNTHFAQDYILGNAFDKYLKPLQKDSHLVFLGDHSFPYGIHENNTLSTNAGWQENFLTSAAIIPAEDSEINKNFLEGYVSYTYYSQLDLLPTLLALNQVNFKNPDILSGSSFLNSAFTESSTSAKAVNSDSSKCLLSIQPYFEKYISVINYPQKFLYELGSDKLEVYNIESDPDEKNPILSGEIQESAVVNFHKCLSSLTK